MRLRGRGDWENSLKVLHKSDVHALNRRELNWEEQDELHHLCLVNVTGTGIPAGFTQV